jgi:hypothetical protein
MTFNQNRDFNISKADETINSKLFEILEEKEEFPDSLAVSFDYINVGCDDSLD